MAMGGGLNNWILDQWYWGVKVLRQAASNVSGQCVGISIVYCSCSHQVFLDAVYCTGEGVD